MNDKPTVVWAEIPVTDLDRAEAFYTSVFGFDMVRQDMGPNATVNFSSATSSSVGGHLYPGTPAVGNGPTIHLALPDTLEAGITRCAARGGKIVSPVITIPPGRFAYATDPDGNSIGLFEPAWCVAPTAFFRSCNICAAVG